MLSYSASSVMEMPEAKREAFLDSLTDVEAYVLKYDWEFWQREKQKIPSGTWTTWLNQCGRGYGKTRVGAETVRIWARSFDLVNLIGATADDARDIMIEGESGILAICPRDERPAYLPSKRQLIWPNGGKSLIFTADEPDRLRGKQHKKVWADEVASWRYRNAWDQMMLGLRLGVSPQVVATTTPKPTRLIKEIIADPGTKRTFGTTYENKSNLSEAFFTHVIKKYEGTRLGRQELEAELLEDNPNALWTHALIDDLRANSAPEDLARVVVAIDPAVTANEDSDDTGLGVAGKDNQNPPHFYVLEDLTCHEKTSEWARRACKAFHTHRADRVVAEVNNGGDLVEDVIRNCDESISYKSVHATRGKILRAEPIAALYEQGRVHHVGTFPQLEDEMCEYDARIADQKSPNRLDWLVWALTELSDDPSSGFLDLARADKARKE